MSYLAVIIELAKFIALNLCPLNSIKLILVSGIKKLTSHPESCKIEACSKTTYIPPEIKNEGRTNPKFLFAIEFK